MRILILSCNTGGGHNACAKAIHEALELQGAVCVTEDALRFISDKASRFISDWHVRIYRHAPNAFRYGYRFTEKYSGVLDRNSGIRKFLTAGMERLNEFIQEGEFDGIVCTHVFSALIVTDLMLQFPMNIRTCFVATDYTCSPGCDMSNMDQYFIPAEALTAEFAGNGVPEERITACGIPVRKVFYRQIEKEAAKTAECVEPSHRHLLMMCGSMGCGPMEELAELIAEQLPENCDLTVVCGTNASLYRKLSKVYNNATQIHIRGYVQDMSRLMDSADLCLTKPGGISVSEAAVKRLPMIFVDAVAGCEEYNQNFFVDVGAAVTADTTEKLAEMSISLLNDSEKLEQMSAVLRGMQQEIPAAEQIYQYLASKEN